MVAAFAEASGAQKALLLDIDEEKRNFAKQIGHKHVLDNGSADWLDELMEISGGRGADLTVECAGAAAAAEGCFYAAKPLGDVILMGNPPGDMNLRQNAYWEILRKQLRLHGTWNSGYTQNKNDWRTALGAMAQNRVDLKQLVTHRFTLSECEKALELMRDKKEFSCRVMFVM
jgi:L-iditol 2-dehydrogenase